MAISSEFNTSNDNIKYHITVTEQSTSRSTNTSTINIKVDAWTTVDDEFDYEGTCFVKVDGSQLTASTWSSGSRPIIYGSSTTIFDDNVTISHNSDGTKRIQVAACFELYKNGYVKVSSSFQSFNFILSSLDVAGTKLISVEDVQVTSSTKINIMASVYNNTYTHDLVIKNGNTVVLTLSGISLSDGENEITLSSQDKSTLESYFSSNNLVAFDGVFVLSTYAGQTQVGSSSTAYAIVRTTPGSGTTLVSLRQAGVGIKNSNPQYPLDVNGTVNCTTLIQSTPNMEVRSGHILKILRW